MSHGRAPPRGGTANPFGTNNPYNPQNAHLYGQQPPPPTSSTRPGSSAHAPPVRPPPSRGEIKDEEMTEADDEDYQAPLGPPPSRRPVAESYAPPSGPPPNWSGSKIKDEPMDDVGSQYQPPPGPPPSRLQSTQQQQKPASHEPSPGSNKRKQPEQEPPDYDPWHAGNGGVNLPPSYSKMHPTQVASSGLNATDDQAKSGHQFCRDHGQLKAAKLLDAQVVATMEAADLRLEVPDTSTFQSIYHTNFGTDSIENHFKTADVTFLSKLPIFSTEYRTMRLQRDPHLVTEPQTIYFELQVKVIHKYLKHERRPPADHEHKSWLKKAKDKIGSDHTKSSSVANDDGLIPVESAIAIGFAAQPYPPNRLPGWHRASIAVHSDDGNRYTNNSYAGTDFVKPWDTGAYPYTDSMKARDGDRVGIGMTFPQSIRGDSVYSRPTAFFTRNGRKEGEWQVHEERDATLAMDGMKVRGYDGLDGRNDLHAAVGICGLVHCIAYFRKQDWVFQPDHVWQDGKAPR